jgi:hypothetical protein
MFKDPVTHDLLLARADGRKRKFRIYGRPMPEPGDAVTLPVDGQLIKARVVFSAEPEAASSIDAEVLELAD